MIAHSKGPAEMLKLLLRANEFKNETASSPLGATSEKRWREMLQTYLDVIEEFGETPDILSAVADCYNSLYHLDLGRGCIETAVAWIKKAIDSSPDRAEFHGRLAEYYSLGMNEYALAYKEYRKAIDLNPCSESALVGAATLYGLPEDVIALSEAIGFLEKAVELNPSEPFLRGRLGQLCLEGGRIDEAVQHWINSLLCPKPLPIGYVEVIKSALGL